MNNLVSDHILDGLACRFQVLARVKMIRMLKQVFADIAGHCEPDVGIDIDFAHGKLCCLAKLILGDTDGIRHIPAVFIDHLYKLLRDGR